MTTILRYSPIRWLLALAWTLWLVIILVQPETQPIVDIGVRPAPPSLEREIVFTIAHLVAFSFTVLLWWWALVDRLAFMQALVMAIIITLALGSMTEVMQTFAPDRHFQWTDLAANAAGTLTTAYFLKLRLHPS